MSWSLLDSGGAGFSDGNGGHLYNFPAGAAVNGDLLVLAVSSDTTVSTPAGWTLPANASDVHNIGAYVYFREDTGGTSAVTVTTSGNFPTAIAFARYSGAAASSLDVAAVAFHTISASTTPALTTPGLAQTGELVVAAGMLGGLQSATQTGITWSAGYTGQVNAATAGTGTSDQRILLATNPAAGTAPESPNVSWTNATNNQSIVAVAFVPAAGPTPKSDSDTGTGADSATATAADTAADTGSGTEATALAAAQSATDTGTGTEGAQYTAAASAADTATGADTATAAASSTSADTGGSSDAAAPAAAITAPDTATGAEAASFTATVAAADSAVASESARVVVTPVTPTRDAAIAWSTVPEAWSFWLLPD